MWCPDDTYQGICLPDAQCQGILIFQTTSVKAFAFGTLRANAYLPTRTTAYHLDYACQCTCRSQSEAGVHVYTILDEDGHSIRIPDGECQSVAFSS